MGTDETMAKVRAARAVSLLPKRAASTADKLASLLAVIPRADALTIARTVRARLAELDLNQPDATMLARIGVGWCSAIADVAQVDGAGAAEAVRLVLGQLKHAEWV